MTRFMRWINGTPDPAPRHRLPGLVAYFWTGGSPRPHPVSNISTSGLYLITKERWLPETVLLMNLQNVSTESDDPPDSISVLSQVVRMDEDGVGLKFVTPDAVGPQGGQVLPPIQADKETLERFLRRFKRSQRAGAK